MTDPYTTPNADLSDVLPPKSATQAWLAFFSALIILLGGWIGLLAIYGRTPWSLGWLVSIRAIAIFLASSMLMGAVFRNFQKISWYWVVLAAPILALMIIVLVLVAYYFAVVDRAGA